MDVVVVGAGLSGLYMLHKLRAQGLSTVVLEANSDVGGTWYANRYPGARVDVESFGYSYSFDPDLEQEFEWSERFATQPELLRYFQHVAERFDLRKDIAFDTSVTSAQYDESGRRWQVRTERGDTVTTRFLVMATGSLSAAKMPEIPGLESFRGVSYHTAQWPVEEVDFTGQRVGVIGTGSSGVQVIPLIAEQAAELTVFQRTPAYALPAHNRPLRPGEGTSAKSDYPAYRKAARESGFGVPMEPPTKSALEASAEEREQAFEEAWQAGGLTALVGTFTDIQTDLDANALAMEFLHRKIAEAATDLQTAADLTPQYPFWSKRPCLNTGYYDAFNRPNVRLVNLQREPLTEVTGAGIRTSAREYELDAIVYATGFDAMTGSFTRVDVRGRGGVSLQEAWAAGPRTYLGLGTVGFPNLFMIAGPGSPSVLSNMVVSIEQHVDWVSDAIAYMERRGLATIEATPTAQDEWVDHVNVLASYTLFPGTDSWFLGANVPGKARVFMPYAGGVGAYRQKCDEVAASGYAGFQFSS
ncbi:flavin-containing monooxygenase [Modestobacter excelsi]|uniref:flavin-containing monooxygenase n=1 Tax=Modestobacter excelsi TaxID=2213161 RepID=UPI001FECAB85|nr:NAD(P)/FAD-dependent oxidoreductase [Modestobacter excelsi]